MAVLSNNGRLISSLPMSSTIVDSDEFLLQSGGVTKRVTYSKIKDTVLVSGLNPYTGVVKLKNSSNVFTGSFYATNFSNFDQVLIRNGLTVSSGNSYFDTIIASGIIYGSVVGSLSGNVNGNLTGNVTGNVTGNLTGNVTGNITGNVTGNVTGNTTGNLTGNVTGDITSTGGTSTFTKATITRLTSSNPILGDLRGDVYTQTGTKVLENGTGATTSNGGIPSAYFYGTSSYSNQALTAAYANSSVSANGLPTGGSQYQILTKKSGTNYDSIWSTPITRSGVPTSTYMSYWIDDKTLAQSPNFYYESANDVYQVQSTFNFQKGAYSLNSAFTGSFVTSHNKKTISSLNVGVNIDGIKYQSATLQLSQSAPVTMSILSGQTCKVLVKNSGAYNVTHWSGSLNGINANAKIYWVGGTEPTITSGNLKKDLITFTNINDYILATINQNFLSKI